MPWVDGYEGSVVNLSYFGIRSCDHTTLHAKRTLCTSASALGMGMGFVVDSASGGRKALKASQKVSPDGHGACCELKAREVMEGRKGEEGEGRQSKGKGGTSLRCC